MAAEDIGKVAYGIFKAGQQYIGKTVGVAGEFLTVNEMCQKIDRKIHVDLRREPSGGCGDLVLHKGSKCGSSRFAATNFGRSPGDAGST